jgi:hypothetical protein
MYQGRNAAREGANLEYLKNVLLAYMTNTVGKDRTVAAIATILQFSPAELSRVRHAAALPASSWWPLSPAKPA